jgi:hypothetical protein
MKVFEMSAALCVVSLLLGGPCAPAYAQAGDPDAVPLPRAFVGAGLGAGTSDAERRMRLVGEGSSLIWLVEGGAALATRVGVGVEFARPTAVSASTSGRSFNTSGRQEERVLVGLVRVRAFGFDRWTLDVAGGGGLLFQHHELRFAPCVSGCNDTTREVLDRRAPAFAFGADVPVRLGRHFAVSALARYYALFRGEHVTELPVLVPWPYEWKSSRRLAISISGRAGW